MIHHSNFNIYFVGTTIEIFYIFFLNKASNTQCIFILPAYCNLQRYIENASWPPLLPVMLQAVP